MNPRHLHRPVAAHLSAAFGALVLAVGGPVEAQERIISGVYLGQDLAAAQTVFRGQATVTITGDQFNRQLVRRNGAHLLVCDGRVVSIQREIGHDLHAFADTAADKTALYGEPRINTVHHRTADGEISTVSVEWPLSGDQLYSVGMLYSGSFLDVTESITQLNDGC